MSERWQEEANCLGADPDIFFPERGENTAEVRQICFGCEVALECLDYALTHNERMGIWGGTSERERRRIRRLGITAAEFMQGRADGTYPVPKRGRPARV